MSLFSVKALIVDREPPIDDKDAPVAMSFALIVDRKALIVDIKPPIDDKDAPIAKSVALIVDRKALIVDTKPLIAHNSHSKDFQNQSKIKEKADSKIAYREIKVSFSIY